MEIKTLEFNARKYWMEELKKTKKSEKLIYDYFSVNYKKMIYHISIDKEYGCKLIEKLL